MSAKRATRRLVLEGDMTIYAAASLKEKLLGALKGASRLQVDLSRVAEVDTAGMQLLVLAKREALAAGKTLRLVGHSAATLDAIDLFALGAYFGDPVFIARRGAPRAPSRRGDRSRT